MKNVKKQMGDIDYKNPKGFTLIELLAVIVILAVIALIVTPIITGVIETAKKGTAVSSAYGYIEAIENEIYEAMDKWKKEHGDFDDFDLWQVCHDAAIKYVHIINNPVVKTFHIKGGF